MHTIYENVKFAVGSLPANATGTPTITGAEIDVQGFEINAVEYHIGDSGDTLSGSVLWTLTLEHSDASGSGFTAVDAADLKAIADYTGNTLDQATNTVVIDAPAEDSRVIVFEYGGDKRYLRGVIVGTGTHTVGTPLAIVNLQSRAGLAPVIG